MRPTVPILLLAGLLAVAEAALAQTDAVRLARKHYQDALPLLRSESWDQAAGKLQAAIALDPMMVVAHYNLGQVRMAQKRYAEAAAAYEAAKASYLSLASLSDKELGERDRERRDELRELRDSLERVRTLKNVNEMQVVTRIEERMRLLESMDLKDQRRDVLPAEIPLALGSAYFRQGQAEAAEREYRHAVRLNPRLGAAHNNLAVLCLTSGRVQEAAAELALAKKSGFPVNPRLEKDVQEAVARSAP